MKLAVKIFISLLLLLAASPSWGVTLATDDFNRADENPLAGNWTTVGLDVRNLQIVGNSVRSTDTGSRAAAYYNAVTPPNDQWTSIKAVAVPTDTVGETCASVRASTVDETSYDLCIATFPAGNFVYDLVLRVNGSYTSLAFDNVAFTAGDIFRLEAQGTTIRALKNGVQFVSVIDSTIASGRFGIKITPPANTANAILDDFQGGDFTSPPQSAVQPMIFE